MSTDTTIEVGDTPLGVTVFEAIQEAGFANNGAPFAPLLIKFTTASELANGWNSQRGDTQISFYSASGETSGDFLPLGDVVTVYNSAAGRAPVMLVAAMPGKTADDGRPLLQHPTEFEWILDDKHSGNPNSVAYFWPIAPDGYEALGVCFGFNGATPDINAYWCVHKQLLQSVPTQDYWSDSGQNWESHNGDLTVADLFTQAPPDLVNQLLLAPTTLLSAEKGGNLGLALVLGKAVLPGAKVAVPDPAYYDNCQQNDTTPPGLVAPVVLPCTIVFDPSQASTPLTDPFYYLASEPYWRCLMELPSQKPSTWSEEITVGTAESDSMSFQRSSSLTVGAESGVEATYRGVGIAVNYTDELQVVTVPSQAGSTTAQMTANVELPAAKVVFIWQDQTNLVIYRGSGGSSSGAGVVDTVLFAKESVVCTPSPS